jgi:serine protease AprX
MGSITTPGIDPSIITVGCCESKDANIKNWKVADFSGRGGRTENIVKPELIAPGVNIMSLSSDKNYIPSPGRPHLQKTLENPYTAMTGTSTATSVATGCIALLLEKMPNLSGKDLKGVLKLSCQTLNEPKPSQGFGVICMEKLINDV